ncbi:hypothetical protein [Kitasatospora sp. NPDC050543]|uniref:hypothetical protein n=1 Tax=Kitasatospora sp. NPDC050543 TaxID=3364054 RepID=UPI0037AF6C4C
MTNLFTRLKLMAQTVALNALAMLRTVLATEPVRVRAAIMSVCSALAVFVPALANASVAGQVAGVVLFVLPIVLGESARARVSPAAN